MAETKVNSFSSRSHVLLKLELDSRWKDGRRTLSKLNFIDLAGSERV